MVSHTPPVKTSSPTYVLAEVRALATQQKVRYASTDVYDDLEKLSLDLQDVCACLASLRPEQFKESCKYEGVSAMDVYRVKNWQLPDGNAANLYIKFKLWGADLMIYVCSLHD